MNMHELHRMALTSGHLKHGVIVTGAVRDISSSHGCPNMQERELKATCPW